MVLTNYRCKPTGTNHVHPRDSVDVEAIKLSLHIIQVKTCQFLPIYVGVLVSSKRFLQIQLKLTMIILYPFICAWR